jgi:RimJ/RimL family protein N-acetyltransferase
MEKTVYFRSFEDEDAELIYKWMNDDSLLELTVGLNRRLSKEEALEWVKARKNHHEYNVYWAVCSKTDDKMIGYASLVGIHYINSSAETGAIMIADPDYNDGTAWIETVLFMFEYAFERLNLHRVYGHSLVGHKISNTVEPLMFMQNEGILRDAAYKNGRYYDLSCAAILRDEYFAHKEAGDFEMISIIRRLRKIRKEQKQ